MPKGERLPRLLKLIGTIQNHPGLTAEELAAECGVSLRQMFRDLRALDYGGVPIYNDNGYRLAGNFLLQDISFSLDEALSLLYGLKLIERQKALFPIQRIKERLLALLPKGLRDGIEGLEPRVDVAQGPAADYSEKAGLFRLVNQAIRESRAVEIEYYCFGRDETNVRVVDPYHLVFKDGFWYLVGFCHWRGDERLFRIDRIKRIHLLMQHFTPPADIHRKPHWSTAWGMEMGKEYLFKVRFWGDSARFVRETQFHPDQVIEDGPEDTVVFTAKAYGLKSVCRWGLSFGGEAEVLEPRPLRDMVSEEIRKAGGRY